MKHLLTGVAIAAALAISASAWAQNAPMKPAGAPAAAPAKPAAAAPAAKKPMKRHVMRHRGSEGDSMTEQLNNQELARIQGGGAPAPAAPPPPGARLPGPKASPQ